MRNFGLLSAACAVCILAVTPVAAQSIDPLEITTDRTVHFVGDDGQRVSVPPGTYTARPVVSRIELADSETNYSVPARWSAHAELLDDPLALSIPGEDPDVHFIVLLLPGGTSLEAWGNYSGVQARGLRSGAPRIAAPAVSKAASSARTDTGAVAGVAPREGGSVLDAIKAKVNSVDSKTSAIRNKIDDLPGTVQSKLGVKMDSEMKDKVFEAFDTLRTVLAEQKEGLQAFVGPDGKGGPGSGCFEFRGALQSLLADSNALTSNILSVTVDVPSPDLGLMRRALNNMPCAALLPASKAFFGLPATQVSAQLNATAKASTKVSALINPKVDRTLICEQVLKAPRAYKGAVIALGGGSLILTAAGSLVHSDKAVWAGDVVVPNPSFQNLAVGIHGYAELSVKKPKVRNKIGSILSFLGESTRTMADLGWDQIHDCEDEQTQVTNQQILQAVCEAQSPPSKTCAEVLEP